EVVARAVVLDQDLSARRDREHQRLAVGTAFERPVAVSAAPSLEVSAAAVALEIAYRVVAHEHDVAAATTVAAVGSTPGYVRLTAKAETPVTPAAGAD